jgi:hypothetical protein
MSGKAQIAGAVSLDEDAQRADRAPEIGAA